MSITQEKRLLMLKTPVGADKLIPISLQGREAMSELFDISIEMVSEDAEIDPAALLGQDITVTVRHTGTKDRHFSGMVRHFSRQMPHSIGLRSYRAVIVPRFWLATLNRDFRIFQDKSAIEIVKEMLGEIPGLDFTVRASGGSTSREYCVQYDETDFNFISRLLEEEGLFYFFRQSDGAHQMIIGDAVAHYEDCAEDEVFLRTGGGFHGSALSSWSSSGDIITGKFVQTDYDFKVPGKELKTEEITVAQPAIHKSQEAYHFPGGYMEKAAGKPLTEALIEASEASHRRVYGAGTTAGLFAGGKTKLAAHPYDGEKGTSFVCVEVRHSAQDHTHVNQDRGNPSYANEFAGLPDNDASTPFRPPRRARRELVRGPLTALVVGPAGEEIYCDKFGRIRVQFHWDRAGAKDENSSCWMRVAQMMAGKNWGSIFIPRIGMEVVVQFLNGDPDRPLVVGAVYNGDNMPPYALPDNKTQSGLKTRSSLNGDTSNFNELRFEDKKGNEQVYFHAEKDFKRHVENNDTLYVGNNQEIVVKNDRSKTIQKGNEAISIEEGNRDTSIAQGNDTLVIDAGNREATLGQGNDTLTLSQGGRTVNLDGSGNYALSLAGGNADVSLASGNYSLDCAGGKVTVTAVQSIELKVGGSSIKIGPASIELKSVSIKVTAQGKADLSAPLTNIDGSGMLKLTGGLIKIN